jgi:hypothetical protein
MTTRTRFLALNVLLFLASMSMAERPASPKHLDWALKLLKDLPAQRTSYRHKNSLVKWKGVDGAKENESYTDCSGFLNALFEQSYGLSEKALKKWLGTARPLAKTYYQAIVKQNQFTRIKLLQDASPGDVIAIRYDRGKNPGKNTGHVLLVVGKPKKIKGIPPQVEDSVQWEVEVLDQSSSGHGKTDTRHRPSGRFRSGLGKGIFRIYTTEEGEILGYTWSTSPRSHYYDHADRPLVIGRLKLK